MTLEDLIYSRLTEDAPLKGALAKYDGKPAVFYQTAPDDTAIGWNQRKQYPRIDYVVDYISNPERKTSAVLTLNIWSTEDGTPPEELEPIIRNILCGIFLKPEDTSPHSIAWARSDAFDLTKGDNIVIGTTVTFDVFAFPTQITSDPDPILATNRYVKLLVPNATVIGQDDITQVYAPTVERPAFYFRLESLRTQRETNTVSWMDAIIAGHVFASGDEIKWLKTVTDMLALDGEVTMLDTSPMFLTSLKVDNTLNALSSGQMRIYCRFGILRRKPFAHKLQDINYITRR